MVTPDKTLLHLQQSFVGRGASVTWEVVRWRKVLTNPDPDQGFRTGMVARIVLVRPLLLFFATFVEIFVQS